MKIILDENDVQKAIEYYVKTELKIPGDIKSEMKTYPTNHIEVKIDASELPF